MLSKNDRKAIALHKKLGGKIRVISASPVKNRADLALIYTPGVAAVSRLLAEKPSEARRFTMKGRTVAVISDGSAVLGLGNIGPIAALPVMEGKAALFKIFGDVDAVPIVLDTQDPDEIVETVARIAPAFGGINLEDIAAPKCFEIERRLIERLNIPVIHDDQHGTAIVVLAGIFNSLKVVGKQLPNARIVISGAGAAGTAIARILFDAGAKKILVLDRQGIISKDRAGLEASKKYLAEFTNPRLERGGLRQALENADILIGVSGPGLAKADDIRIMAPHAIVFAMANPVPEIMPDEAKKGGAEIIATGRSDFPNQVNNSLVFPGLFRGALDNDVRHITDKIKVNAARALAGLVKRPTAKKILPDMFDKRVAKAVAHAVQ